MYFIVFLGGKGGKCTMHRNALRRPVWGSSKACRWACSLVGQSGLPTYPLNPSTPGGPATSRYVKSTIGLDLRSNSARHIPAHRTRCSCYRTNPLTAFHDTRRVPTFPHKVCNEVLENLSCLNGRYCLRPRYCTHCNRKSCYSCRS